MKVEPRDPKKIYISIRQAEVIAGLVTVVLLLSVILNIINYVK